MSRGSHVAPLIPGTPVATKVPHTEKFPVFVPKCSHDKVPSIFFFFLKKGISEIAKLFRVVIQCGSTVSQCCCHVFYRYF